MFNCTTGNLLIDGGTGGGIDGGVGGEIDGGGGGGDLRIWYLITIWWWIIWCRITITAFTYISVIIIKNWRKAKLI